VACSFDTVFLIYANAARPLFWVHGYYGCDGQRVGQYRVNDLVQFELEDHFRALWAIENHRTEEIHGDGVDYVCKHILGQFCAPSDTCPQNLTIQGDASTASDVLDSGGQWRMNTTETPDGHLKRVPSSEYVWGFSSGYTVIFSVLTMLSFVSYYEIQAPVA